MPAVLRKFGNLDKEVVWVGVGDRLEIWNSDKWNEQMMSYLEGDDVEEKIEDLASYMAEKGIKRPIKNKKKINLKIAF